MRTKPVTLGGVAEFRRWWHAFVLGHWQYVYIVTNGNTESMETIRCDCGKEWLV